MRNLSVVFIVVFAFASPSFSQASDRGITDIRKVYEDTNAQIAEMQKAPDLSSIFVVEVVVNKNLASYPAVGIYQSTATFYYSYGDREKDPYPNRLLKIDVDMKRAANNGHFEYLFDTSGALIFAFAKPDRAAASEQRSYFQAGKLIRSTEDGKDLDLRSKDATEAGKAAKREADRLVRLFKGALTEN